MNRPQVVFILALGLALFCGSLQVLAQDVSATQSYVVQKGDTLGSIAKKFYGKSSLGNSLWRANKNLVLHPKKLTAGDTIYIFPENTLALNKDVSIPPLPVEDNAELYEPDNLMTLSFPKYFSYVADIRGQGQHGSTRIRVKKINPTTRKEVDELYEARIVGEIISSSDRGATVRNDGLSNVIPGRLLLSTGDNVILRFTEDLAKLRDSDTYEDADPYFNPFPIYSVSEVVQEPDKNRADYGQSLGNIMRYRGTVNVISRIEGLAPSSPSTSGKIKRGDKQNQDIEPVSYVARITYSEDAIELGDKIMYFVPLSPGPERRLDAPYVEPADTFVSPGQ